MSKEKKKDPGLLLGDPLRSGKKSRNQFTIPKYKTNDYKNTALARFTKDAKLQKTSSTGIPTAGDKNTSAVIGNYPKISESMTFDYSVDSQSSKARLNKVAHALISNFDP